MNIDVSVIVTLYRPDLDKTIRTLQSILKQRDINFEIIITDDGSSKDFFKEIRAFFDEKGFSFYHMTKLEENVGTVANVMNGIKLAVGEYVFLTSPGDVLYHEDVLRDFKEKACEQKAAIVFGNAVYYHLNNDNQPCFHEVCVQPYWPEQYNKLSLSQLQASFYFGNYILGAAVLRERESFFRCLQKIAKYCKYIEDNTTTALFLGMNVRPYYYDRNIVFYEYGGGISTNKQEAWIKILNNDFYHVFEYVSDLFPDNAAVQAKLYSIKKCESSWDKVMRFFKYPSVSIRIVLNKMKKKKRTSFDKNDIQRFIKMTGD